MWVKKNVIKKFKKKWVKIKKKIILKWKKSGGNKWGEKSKKLKKKWG